VDVLSSETRFAISGFGSKNGRAIGQRYETVALVKNHTKIFFLFSLLALIVSTDFVLCISSLTDQPSEFSIDAR
jgi:hypothetical protein